MAEKTFTGASLEQALKSGAIKTSGITLVGMVKPAEKEGFVSFSRTDCETWVDLPTDLIDEAEHQGEKTCRDHSHPVFRLILKEPRDREAQIFAALLAAPPPAHSHASPHPMQAQGPGPQFRAGTGPGRSPNPPYPPSQSSARLQGGWGGWGGWGGFGGLSAWGCWESECCECTRYGTCWPTGDGRVICECIETTCKPCTRCIWPW
jgi:hypothetical protein